MEAFQRADARLTQKVSPLWLHPSHGTQPSDLAPLQATNLCADCRNVASAFVAGVSFASSVSTRELPFEQASNGQGLVGLPCHIVGQHICVEDGKTGSVTEVVKLMFSEITYAPLSGASRQDADLVAIAVLLPHADVGIDGTSLNRVNAVGRAVWIILCPGGGQHFKVLDEIGAAGGLRSDMFEVFSFAAEDGSDLIGEGAYATVRCMTSQTGTDSAAVKLLNSQVELTGLEREVATLIAVQRHDHIVGFRGTFWRQEVEGNISTAIAFEVLPCGDLLYKVLKFGSVSESEARPLMRGVLRALVYIHSQNIVHRDIKAENILLRTPNHAMVVDFGLATWISDETQMARRCGSPGYVAPEVCLGVPYGFKVDVFGAGIVLYFLLSKEMPFSSPDRDTAATMRRTVKCSLHLHRHPWDKLTSRLRNALRQSICKNQEERLTAVQALEHPWMSGPEPRPALTQEQLHALQMIQSRLDHDQLAPLEETAALPEPAPEMVSMPSASSPKDETSRAAGFQYRSPAMPPTRLSVQPQQYARPSALADAAPCVEQARDMRGDPFMYEHLLMPPPQARKPGLSNRGVWEGYNDYGAGPREDRGPFDSRMRAGGFGDVRWNGASRLNPLSSPKAPGSSSSSSGPGRREVMPAEPLAPAVMVPRRQDCSVCSESGDPSPGDSSPFRPRPPHQSLFAEASNSAHGQHRVNRGPPPETWQSG